MMLSSVEQVTQSLKDGTALATSLCAKAAALQAKLKALREFQGQAQELDSLSTKPVVIVHQAGESEPSQGAGSNTATERWLRDMQEENQELRSAVGEMRSALDLIMKKHRSQVHALVETKTTAEEQGDKRAEEERLRASRLEEEVVAMTGQLEEMTRVMCAAAEADARAAPGSAVELSRLRTENESLREMLGIAGMVLESSGNNE
eukprot:m.483379 g.483379  ORF g.483379 m.483379 type:complete len:205 (+) comp22912_c0_seq1:125-739(+)